MTDIEAELFRLAELADQIPGERAEALARRIESLAKRIRADMPQVQIRLRIPKSEPNLRSSTIF